MVVELGFEPRLPRSRVPAFKHPTCFQTPITFFFTNDPSLAALLLSAFKALCSPAPAHFWGSISTPRHHSSQGTLPPRRCVCCFLGLECCSPPLGLVQGLACKAPPSEAPPDLLITAILGHLSLQELLHLTEHLAHCTGGSCQGPTGLGAPQSWDGSLHIFVFLLHPSTHSFI